MAVTLNQNQFFTGLVNFILFMRVYATNTSNKPASILSAFATETLEFGDQKAYPFAELPKVEDYSNDPSSLLTKKVIKYSEEFIGNPIRKKISLSRCEPYLKMATMNGAGFAMFNAYILGLMESAKEDYLYTEIIKDLISWSPANGGTAGKELLKTVDLLPTAGVTNAVELNAIELHNQKQIELAWQKTFDDFSIYTDVFLDINNATESTNYKTALNMDDLVFIGNAKFLNERVVNLMATMLKSDIIDKNFKTPLCIKVPQRTFDANNQSDTIGFVAHKHWYQWFYHFMFMGSFFDIDTLNIKNVLHFWYSKGRLKGLPASKLTAKVIEVNPDDNG